LLAEDPYWNTEFLVESRGGNIKLIDWLDSGIGIVDFTDGSSPNRRSYRLD
jgi:hypothetical protein